MEAVHQGLPETAAEQTCANAKLDPRSICQVLFGPPGRQSASGAERSSIGLGQVCAPGVARSDDVRREVDEEQRLARGVRARAHDRKDVRLFAGDLLSAAFGPPKTARAVPLASPA